MSSELKSVRNVGSVLKSADDSNTEGYLVMIDSVFEGQTLPELKVKKKTDFIPVLDVTVWVIARRNRFCFLLLDGISKILVFMFCF